MNKAAFEIHYHLAGNSHEMDAILHNKADGELLALATRIIEELGLPITIEIASVNEGGLRDIWKFIGNSKDQLGWILAIVTLILTRFPSNDAETELLNKELLRANIEEKKLNIHKLRKEIDSEAPTKSKVSAVTDILETDAKVVTRRSNFYKNLISTQRVTAIGFTPIPSDHLLKPEEQTVHRNAFANFIQQTSHLPVEKVEDATIEMVAPVLKEGNYHWKGLYNGTPISFAMLDQNFKSSVLLREISFTHGSAIVAALNIHRKLNEVGDLIITGYSVATVVSRGDVLTQIETPQGKKRRYNLSHRDSQPDMFNISE